MHLSTAPWALKGGHATNGKDGFVRDLTQYAIAGYDAEYEAQSEYALGSSAHVAWLVGRWLKANGGVRPTTVTAEPGYAVRVDGVKVEVPAGATGAPQIAPDS